MRCPDKVRHATLRAAAEQAAADWNDGHGTRPYSCNGVRGCDSFHVTSDLRGVTYDDICALVAATGGRMPD